MTVKELIEKLKKFPQDLPVVMSKHAGGNDTSPLSIIGHAWYFAESTWNNKLVCGGVCSDEELKKMRDDAMRLDIEPVVCFWPVK